MARVICDTSFLMHVANTRIKNEASLDTEIGRLDYVVPGVVVQELEHLAGGRKAAPAGHALEYARKLGGIRLAVCAGTADDVIVYHIARNGGMVATMDMGLKARVRKAGGSILSVANDRIVLERQAKT